MNVALGVFGGAKDPSAAVDAIAWFNDTRRAIHTAEAATPARGGAVAMLPDWLAPCDGSRTRCPT